MASSVASIAARKSGEIASLANTLAVLVLAPDAKSGLMRFSTAVEKAMEDATADQAARLSRKVEYLSVVGNLAPMLGLLGTVFGMVLAFREVAATQGVARASDLADGIYQALITTVAGLIVAIPALAAFAFFRSRVDQLVAEVTYAAQHVFTPLKRYRRRKALEAAEK